MAVVVMAAVKKAHAHDDLDAPLSVTAAAVVAVKMHPGTQANGAVVVVVVAGGGPATTTRTTRGAAKELRPCQITIFFSIFSKKGNVIFRANGGGAGWFSEKLKEVLNNVNQILRVGGGEKNRRYFGLFSGKCENDHVSKASASGATSLPSPPLARSLLRSLPSFPSVLGKMMTPTWTPLPVAADSSVAPSETPTFFTPASPKHGR